MDNDILKLLLGAIGPSIADSLQDPRGVVAILLSETVRFRDKLKEDTGRVLTVGDTRASLDALQQYLDNGDLPDDLTSEQEALVQIWIDRLTLFRSQ